MNILHCSKVAVLGSLIVALPIRGAILQAVTADATSVSNPAASGSAGQSENLPPQVTDKPVRGGKFAFKHSLNETRTRSALATMPTAVGSIYWYGWSLQLPENFE